MKIVCSTLPFRKLSVADALQKMAGLGIRQVELCVDPRHSDIKHWNIAPQKVVQQQKYLKVHINSIHVPLVKKSEMMGDKELQKTWTDATIRTIDLAVYLKAAFIVQHIYFKGSLHTDRKSMNWEKMLPDMIRAAEYAAEKGVKIALENVLPASDEMNGAGVRDLMDVVKSFPHNTIGICLDVTHCMAVGLDPLDALNTVDINRLMSIHASDNYYDSFKDQHLSIGRGDINWKKFLKKLNSLGFKGTLVVEVAGNGEDGKTVIDSFEHLQHIEIIA